MNLEFLVFVLLELVELEFIVFGHGQAFVVVDDRYDFVGCFGLGLEFGRNIRNFICFFFGLLLNFSSLGLDVVSRDDQPSLVVVAMKLPLANLSVGIGFASFDVQRFPIREGVDVASLSSPLPLGNRDDFEETALKLSGVRFDSSSISFVFLLNVEGSAGGGVDEGVLLVVLVDVEELIGGAVIVVDGEFVVIVAEGEGLLVVHNADDLVGEVGVRGEEEVLWSLHQ